MDFLLARSVGDQRFVLVLMLLLAGLALVLASVGLYGVMAYGVAQRTSEIGLRLALGAQRRHVLRMVLGQGMRLVLPGLALGWLASLWVTGLMRQMLFEVSVTDKSMFALIAVVLTMVALLACWIPARRATQVDPMVALRSE
jgi:putative ABC transport system permease protein